jgi:hypothetical protein
MWLGGIWLLDSINMSPLRGWVVFGIKLLGYKKLSLNKTFPSSRGAKS